MEMQTMFHIRKGASLRAKYAPGTRIWKQGGRKAADAQTTRCGAATTESDIDRRLALHFIKYETIKPDWTVNMCPLCRQRLSNVNPTK